MFLSRVELNLKARPVRRDLANPYAMHSTLTRLFAEPDEKPERFLWRLEVEPDQARLLLQSHRPPVWERVQNADTYFSEIDPAKPLDQYFESLQIGKLFRFRLKANPVVTKAGKRLGLSNIEEQLNWLSERVSTRGFQILGAMVSTSEREKYTKANSNSPPIIIQTATFDGHLRVTDPECAKTAVLQGIGPAKAFGCGLLTLARA